MTVKELIEKLKEMPGDAEVEVSDDGEWWSVRDVRLYAGKVCLD